MVRLSFFASALFAVSATAQLLASTLPQCASQCSLLLGAQASCATTPATEVSCFCQDAQLAVIKSSPGTNQCTVCSDTDWATIAAWYNNACANNGAAFSTLATVTSAAATASSSSALSGTGGPAGTDTASASGATSAVTQTPQAGTASSNTYTGSNAADYSNGQQWWAGHYQWIIMIIVLLIAFLVLGIGGRILFKRQQRRKNLGSSSGPAGSWAPNSGAHDFDVQGRQALAAAGPVTEEKTEGPRKTRTLTRKLMGR